MKKFFKEKYWPTIGAVLLKLWYKTLRVHVIDCDGILATLERRNAPLLAAFWHNRLILSPNTKKLLFKNRKCAALISRSRDGQTIANLLKKFNISVIKGSSTRYGSVAFREMLQLIEKGYAIGITPDGPRGPRYELKAGITTLGEMTGAPIVPLRIYMKNKKQLQSWDKFQLPLPFSKCEIRINTAMVIPKTLTQEERSSYEVRLRGLLGV